MVSADELEVLQAHATYSLFALLVVKEDEIRDWARLGYSADPDEEMRISIIKSELGRRGVFGWALTAIATAVRVNA